MGPQKSEALEWYGILPRLGNAAEFGALRELLTRHAYSYVPVCRRLEVEHLYLLTTAAETRYLEGQIGDGLDVLIRLFLIGRAVDREACERLLGRGEMDSLRAFELLVDGPADVFAPFMLHPVPGGVMACDRNATPQGIPVKELPPDALYPPLFQNTLDFVARFSRKPCEKLLEIGTGTGTAAIAWSEFAQDVVATDIAARAVHFAEFNRRLAGAANVTVLEGDLYAPVEGMSFDRIACHPPFVPARHSSVIFRDGGSDGEEIARRIIEDLSRFLWPNGLFWASFMISDRSGEPAERRIRSWLGERETEFDIGLAMETRRTPAETIARAVLDGVGSAEQICYLGELWKGNGTEYLIHAFVVIRRHAGSRAGVTMRTQTGQGFTADALEWLLDWAVAQQSPGFSESLLESRPSLATRGVFVGSHRVEDCAVVSEDFTFEPDAPFRASCRCPAWMMEMLLGCDGSRTVRDHFTALQAVGKIPEDARPAELCAIVTGLVSAGALAVSLPACASERRAEARQPDQA